MYTGSNLGFVDGKAVNARVGSPKGIIYTQEQINAEGKHVSQCCKFPALVNEMGGKVIALNCVVWGTLADTCARVCSPGKELSFNFDLSSYQGKVYLNGQAVRLNNGEFLRTQKHSMTITKIRFGSESDKQIKAEIAKGARPANWDRPEGAALWAEIKAKRKAMLATPYDGKSERFGFARVIPLAPGCRPVSASDTAGKSLATGATKEPETYVQLPKEPYVPQEAPKEMTAGAVEPW